MNISELKKNPQIIYKIDDAEQLNISAQRLGFYHLKEMTFPLYPCTVEDIAKDDKCRGKQEPKELQFDDCHRQHQLQTTQLLRPESTRNFFDLIYPTILLQITRYETRAGLTNSQDSIDTSYLSVCQESWRVNCS